MTHLLDTDHISILQIRSGTDYGILLANLSQIEPTEVCVSVVSLQEQTIGCQALINNFRKANHVLMGYELLARIIEDYRIFPIARFDNDAIRVYDQLTTLKLKIGTMDLRIASIAISRNLVLVTRNTRDFSQIPALKIEDWTR